MLHGDKGSEMPSPGGYLRHHKSKIRKSGGRGLNSRSPRRSFSDCFRKASLRKVILCADSDIWGAKNKAFGIIKTIQQGFKHLEIV